MYISDFTSDDAVEVPEDSSESFRFYDNNKTIKKRERKQLDKSGKPKRGRPFQHDVFDHSPETAVCAKRSLFRHFKNFLCHSFLNEPCKFELEKEMFVP